MGSWRDSRCNGSVAIRHVRCSGSGGVDDRIISSHSEVVRLLYQQSRYPPDFRAAVFHELGRGFLPAARTTTKQIPTKYFETTAPGCYNILDYFALALRFIFIYAARESSNRKLSLRVYRPGLSSSLPS
jgi:hypothetical protein